MSRRSACHMSIVRHKWYNLIRIFPKPCRNYEKSNFNFNCWKAGRSETRTAAEMLVHGWITKLLFFDLVSYVRRRFKECIRMEYLNNSTNLYKRWQTRYEKLNTSFVIVVTILYLQQYFVFGKQALEQLLHKKASIRSK